MLELEITVLAPIRSARKQTGYSNLCIIYLVIDVQTVPFIKICGICNPEDAAAAATFWIILSNLSSVLQFSNTIEALDENLSSIRCIAPPYSARRPRSLFPDPQAATSQAESPHAAPPANNARTAHAWAAMKLPAHQSCRQRIVASEHANNASA